MNNNVLLISALVNKSQVDEVLESIDTCVKETKFKEKIRESYKKFSIRVIISVLLSFLPILMGVFLLINCLKFDSGFETCHYYIV